LDLRIVAASGQGSGDVEFQVTPNDESSARAGDIVVNESRVRVSQRAPCRYNVGPQNQSVNAGADAGGVTVATQSECGGRQQPMSAGSTCLPHCRAREWLGEFHGFVKWRR
jgi:hypothetical protein